ncbi:MAG: hypothetical protein ACR2FY_01475 [Pirellulaceae bacterium]
MLPSSLLKSARVVALALVSLLALGNVCRATDLSGHWSGTWASGNTRHHGPLQAEFVRLNDSEYEVFFRGKFFAVLPFRYSVVMTASEQDGVVTMSGSKYLGRMFGTFQFSAAATDTNFNANYSSCKDQGCFEMTRCSYSTCCAK